VVLVPVGSLEPHGPHLPLSTDTTISEVASLRAAKILAEQHDLDVYLAPNVSYGVTDYARGFKGAVSVPAEVLKGFLRSIAESLIADGWAHVCFVNNHLEPSHDAAVRGAIEGIAQASVACPLTKRWARTLSDEFKRGDCHAGRYETSLALAGGALVRDEFKKLPKVEVSLADQIKAGKKTFQEMGLDRAYTGAPGEATKEEGEELFDRLAEMIVTEVTEGLARK
jgi:creatinine amidohydrolase